jgi:hypothetical protein
MRANLQEKAQTHKISLFLPFRAIFWLSPSFFPEIPLPLQP